jgi:L-ascorbate metabolism protein UlaG (beta-lactamase superfamily)
VIVSHNHYDHLSYPTILKIKEKNPSVQFFAPLGNKAWFLKSGIQNITEMDWWDTNELMLSKTTESEAKIKVTSVDAASKSDSDPAEISARIGCTPCQHMSARTLFDKAHTLWASWVVESGGKKVWFAGYFHAPFAHSLDSFADYLTAILVTATSRLFRPLKTTILKSIAIYLNVPHSLKLALSAALLTSD